jgi:hypothetical protein
MSFIVLFIGVPQRYWQDSQLSSSIAQYLISTVVVSILLMP